MSKKKIYIVGAGTLGRFLVEIIENTLDYEVGGFFDDNYPKIKNMLGYSILGKIQDVNLDTHAYLAIGIGDPKFREDFFTKRKKDGFHFPAMVHQQTVISKYAIIEDGVIIGPYSSVLGGSIIGENTCVLSHVNVNQDVKIGKSCLIGAGVIVGNQVEIGEGCHISLGVQIPLGKIIDNWQYIK